MRLFSGLDAWDWRFRCSWVCLFFISGCCGLRMAGLLQGAVSIYYKSLGLYCGKWVGRGGIKVCHVHKDPPQNRR